MDWMGHGSRMQNYDEVFSYEDVNQRTYAALITTSGSGAKAAIKGGMGGAGGGGKGVNGTPGGDGKDKAKATTGKTTPDEKPGTT